MYETFRTESKINKWAKKLTDLSNGGGAFRPLLRDRGVKKLYGDCTNVSPPQRGGAVLAPPSERWAKMARQLSRGPDHPVAPNRLEFLRSVT